MFIMATALFFVTATLIVILFIIAAIIWLIIAIIPAYKVEVNVASPKLAPTVFELISVSLAGKLPLFIKSTKLLASSFV